MVEKRRDLRGQRQAVHARRDARGASAAHPAAEGVRRGHPLAHAGTAHRSQEPQGQARELLRDQGLHGGEPGVRQRGGLQGIRGRRASAGDEGHSRLGRESHGVRPRVGDGASGLLRAQSGWLAHERSRQRGSRDRLDGRGGAAVRQRGDASGDDRRDEVVGRLAPASMAFAATSRAECRSTSGSRRGRRSRQRVPICSSSPRRKIRACMRRST